MKPEIIAFVGPSGTGKSHRAINVAFQYKCDGIIDDGLLIQGTKILAGTSAKNEENKIQAVKRAIFTSDKHAAEVRYALENSDIKRLLVIATSDHMIERICAKLDLPKPTETVYISDIATKSEIKTARYTRMHEGKHIVPVPSVELKPHFTGYFANISKNIFSDKAEEENSNNEYSIVRPNFSFYGKLLIADAVIKDIVALSINENIDIKKITDIKITRRSDGSKGIIISTEVVLYYGIKIREAVRFYQKKIKQAVEFMTGLQVNAVRFGVRELAIREKK
ncbi:MAG: Asp23/Gls24 family envelope stress response protein [Phascolarctobacterium sp.]|nr:Asp23/Gls24 family envelope stress response protein [Candidatus Phascolarctobacterium equi]